MTQEEALWRSEHALWLLATAGIGGSDRLTLDMTPTAVTLTFATQSRTTQELRARQKLAQRNNPDAQLTCGIDGMPGTCSFRLTWPIGETVIDGDKWTVYPIINGCSQEPVFSGTKHECRDYINRATTLRPCAEFIMLNDNK